MSKLQSHVVVDVDITCYKPFYLNLHSRVLVKSSTQMCNNCGCLFCRLYQSKMIVYMSKINQTTKNS